MSIRRLTIQAERGSDSSTIDIALPAGTPVCALLPTLVSWAELGPRTDVSADDWRLDRLSGTTIDDSMTLAENGVHDGELLLLTSRDAPVPALVQWDPSRTVAAAVPSTTIGFGVGPSAVCVWAAITTSIALTWTGSGAYDKNHLIAAAAGSCAMAIGAIVTRGIGLQTAAVCLAATTGFLAVPADPCAAAVFLAASAGFSMSFLMLRFGSRPASSSTTGTLVATASLCILTAAATLAPVMGSVSTSTVGATLATASLGLLAIAPRLSIFASGLRPEEHPDDCDARSTVAHATLTGLVAGCSGAAATGALVVAVGSARPDPRTLGGIAFTLVCGAALLLRARTYVDNPRRTALSAAGLCCLSASFAMAVCAAPAHAGWTSTIVIVTALASVAHRGTGPRMVRAVELIEYAMLAAVLPLACWIGGVYAFIRESHLL